MRQIHDIVDHFKTIAKMIHDHVYVVSKTPFNEEKHEQFMLFVYFEPNSTEFHQRVSVGKLNIVTIFGD